MTDSPVFDSVKTRDLMCLDFVVWDRYAVADTGDLVVYGWISRKDGRSDFVVLTYTPSGGRGYVTSSAERTAEIGSRLGFAGDSHSDCLRVEDAVPSGLANVVRLGEAVQP